MRKEPLTAFLFGVTGIISFVPIAGAGVVKGTVVLGPMCPGPARQGQLCADKAISTTIDVFRSRDYPSSPAQPFRVVKSDHQGRFQISLDQGAYWFVPHVPRGRAGISFPKPVEVIVTARTTTITLTVDTGMR